MQYPELKEIADPLIRLPLDLGVQVRPVMVRVAAELRSTRSFSSGKAWNLLDAAATEILEILLSREQPEAYKDLESLRRVIEVNADTALMAIHHVHKLAGLGRIPLMWHAQFQERLQQSEIAKQIETQWWEKQAEAKSDASTTAPDRSGPSPRHQGVLDTPTARRIEEFRQRIEAAGRRVRVSDLVSYCGYGDPTMFQRVQREAENASQESREVVERMLACASPEEFWRIVEANQKKRNARR